LSVADPAVTAQTIGRAFEIMASRQPDAIALSLDGRTLSYGQLDRAANGVARRLVQLGIRPDEVVGVGGGRGIETVVACLGVVKAGGAYLPLDPSHPAERTAFALAEAGCPVLLAAPGFPRVEGTATRLPIAWDTEGADEGPLDLRERSDALAYVIYTSGSTGTPKGVMIEHAGVLNMVAWAGEALGLAPGVVSTWAGAPAFDISALEIWSCLLSGGRLEILGETLHEPPALQAWLLSRQVQVAFLVTPQAEGLLGLDWPAGGPLRILATGGDVLRRRPGPDAPFRLLNMYGPTEVTVLATAGWVTPAGDRLPSIGSAIRNTRIHLLDAGGAPVAAGAVGEICIAGPGVARGYVGAPPDGRERFLPDPSGAGRLYRTGDHGRWDRDKLEFLGRRDTQVKLRGYRIELAEIEAALMDSGQVAAAAVCVDSDRETLAAHVVPAAGGRINVATLKEQLRARLPAYMVPAFIQTLGALPMTSTGKIDRARLPSIAGPQDANGFVAPRDDLERDVASVWCDLLKLERLGVRDNFFDVGGQSLQAARLVGELRRRYALSIGVHSLLEYPTVEELVQQVIRPALAASPPALR
jgi:amino acid adenylation domain-containing protein